MLYLTAPELAELCDCKANQFAIMERRLRAGGWPYVRHGDGCPKVLRSYHDQRMRGQVPTAEAASNAPSYTPNRAALEALQNGRKNKAA